MSEGSKIEKKRREKKGEFWGTEKGKDTCFLKGYEFVICFLGLNHWLIKAFSFLLMIRINTIMKLIFSKFAIEWIL